MIAAFLVTLAAGLAGLAFFGTRRQRTRSRDCLANAMEPTKIDLDISLLHIKQMEVHIKQMEAGASSLRSRIARIREYGVATVAEEDELAGLLRAIEVLRVHVVNLRVHVVNMTAPAEGAVANIAAPMSPIGA